MARLDDARVDRSDRDLEDAFAFDLAELVPFAVNGGSTVCKSKSFRSG